MSDRKSVLVIGLEPTLIDFSAPDSAEAVQRWTTKETGYFIDGQH